MKIILTLLLIVPFLSGCAVFSLFGGNRVDPIDIQYTAVDRIPLNLSDPAPLRLKTPQWIVITPENADNVWEELKNKNTNLVLFAVTDQGYENLSLNMVEIRNFINMQRQIIIKYKEYYEPKE